MQALKEKMEEPAPWVGWKGLQGGERVVIPASQLHCLPSCQSGLSSCFETGNKIFFYQQQDCSCGKALPGRYALQGAVQSYSTERVPRDSVLASAAAVEIAIKLYPPRSIL